MSSSTWQDHFKEQLVGLEPPREGSFLELALSEGRIKEKDYLDWASERLSLPLLSVSYFTEMTPDEELLRRANLPWRSTLFPVHFWDGHLIVAGLEAPASLPAHCSFVLAPREGLALWWEKLSEHSAPLEGPEGIDLGPSQGQEEPSLDLEIHSAAAPSLSFSGASLVASRNTEAPSVSTDSDSKIEIAEILVEPSNEPAAIATTETSSVDIQITRTSISLEPEGIPAPHGDSLSLKFNPTLEKHLLTETTLNVTTYKTHIQKALTQISGAYPKTMFLVLDEKKQTFIPLAWSESFGSPQNLLKIPISHNGFFQIVAATEKPYHGYVVPNEQNSQFLQTWNEGLLPDTMTIVPLVGAEGLLGALLGIGPKESYSMQILRYVEKTAQELLKTWNITPAHKAA